MTLAMPDSINVNNLPVMPADRCGDDLMEDDWVEGFRCTLPPGHNGPHRDTSDWDSDNVSTSSAGKRYRWIYEWRYVDDASDA